MTFVSKEPKRNTQKKATSNEMASSLELYVTRRQRWTVTVAGLQGISLDDLDAHHIRHWADGGDTSIDNLVLLCHHHHRLVHEGGGGVEQTADGHIRFSRPDGRFIEEHPQLPASGNVEGLLHGNRETGEDIDAASWIIPGDTLDYGIAIEGLMRKREQESCGCQAGR